MIIGSCVICLVQAAEMNIPILIDAERNKSGLSGLLDLASYIICSEKFAQVYKKTYTHTLCLLLQLFK